MISLVAHMGGRVRGEWAFAKDNVSIGRTRDNDVVLPDEAVSRNHAEIFLREGMCYIRDLDSRNGVFVNDIQVLERQLVNEDRILIGNIVLVFQYRRRTSDRSVQDLIQQALAENGISSTGDTLKLGSDQKDDDSGGVAVAEKDATESLRRRVEILSGLNQIILHSSDPGQLIERVLSLIEQHMRFQQASILVKEEEAGRMERVASRPRIEPEMADRKRLDLLAAELVVRHEGILCKDLNEDTRFGHLKSVSFEGAHSLVCAPMIGDVGLMGAIVATRGEDYESFSMDDLKFLLALGAEVGRALENFRLKEESRRSQRMAFVGELMAGVSQHVKRSVLLTRSSAERLEEALGAGSLESTRGAWELFKHNQEKAMKLIEDLLFYARSRPGDYDRVDINRLVEDVVRILKPRLAKEGIEIELTLDETVGSAWIEPESFQRSLLNLFYHAWESMENQEGGMIRVSSENISDRQFSIAVQDNGQGVPESQKAFIYEPFHPMHDFRGSGLGLALARRLVAGLGGSMEFESEQDVGSSFTIILPLHRSRPDEMTVDQDFMSGSLLD